MRNITIKKLFHVEQFFLFHHARVLERKINWILPLTGQDDGEKKIEL